VQVILIIGLLLGGRSDPLVHVGTLANELRSPARVAIGQDGTVYVTDLHHDHIARFDSAGTFLGAWPVPEGPIGVAAHSDGRFFVSLRDATDPDQMVAIHDAAFTFVGYLGDGLPMVNFVRPTDIDIASDTGNIYVVDAEGDRIYGFAPDGSVDLIVGIRGGGAGEYRYPSAVTVDEGADRLLVADHDNFRVQAFTTGGIFETHFGYRLKFIPGENSQGWTPRTQGLAVDGDGRIYVADALMCTVRVFDPTGEELAKVVDYGFAAGDLRTPCDLALSDDGTRLYVVSTNTSSVEIYETPDWGRYVFSGGDGDKGGGGPPGTNWSDYDLIRLGVLKSADQRRLTPAEPGGGPDFMRNYDGPHMVDDSPVICGRCHGIPDLPGGHEGLVEGQQVLCFSCHSAGGQGLDMPQHELNMADPYGTNPDALDGRGISHAWGVPAINADADSIGPAAGSPMAYYIDGGDMKCSTCHDQHQSFYAPYLRMSNAGDAICKECHAARNEGLGERGTHPVGFDYPGGTGEFPDDATLTSVVLKADKVECLTCHAVHDATSGDANGGEGDGMLLRAANDETLCQICHAEHLGHAAGGPWQPTCNDCHDTHDPDNENLALVAVSVFNQTLGIARPVVFTAQSGPNSFDDGDPAENNGVCQVCHTETNYHKHDGTGSSHYDGENCTTCHPHDAGFMPSGSCTSCHSVPQDNGDGVPPGGRAAILNPDGTGGHDLGGGVLGDDDCATCHEMTRHMQGQVRLWEDPVNPVTPLPVTGDPAELVPFCTACHAPPDHPTIHDIGAAWEPVCTECHEIHDPTNVNLTLVSDLVYNQTLDQDFPVVLTERTGPNGFGDAGAQNDGICQVCHTSTTYHLYDGSGAGHYSGADCITCHPHDSGFRPSGGACDACHGQPPDGAAFPNTAGSHAAHMTAPGGPAIADCYVCHATLGDTHINDLASFATGVDDNGNSNIDLDETDVCDACHSPDGPFDGVDDPEFGARANWLDGVYEADELAAGKELWCAGCHDTGTSVVHGVSAPPVAGDNLTWGFYLAGHGRRHGTECADCHDFTTPHFDGLEQTYSFDSAYYGPSQSGVAYAAGYRLRYVDGEPPLMIPANYNITFDYDAGLMKETAFRLCFDCHNADNIFDDTPGDGLDTNFKASLPNPPRNYSYAWGSGADVNEHVSHILNYTGPFADSDWDAATNGPGGQDGRDTMTACSSCHNVHGAAGNCGATNEPMIRDGVLVGRSGYGFSYVIEDVGAGGYPMVTSIEATQSISVGAIFRNNTADMCGGSMCHGNPDPPLDCGYDATGSSWESYLEYYRPWADHNSCVSCHGHALDNGDGTPPGGRRAVKGEFPVGDAHAHYGAQLTSDACLVCHYMPGHMDGVVNLTDADDGGLYSFVTPSDLASDPDISDFCSSCHDADGAARLASPADPFGAGNASPDIASKLLGTLQWDEWYGGPGCFGDEGTLRAVNSHHDISDADQSFSGAKIECLDCHGAHTSGASQPLVDPFSTLTPWTNDGNRFCLSCHDGGAGPANPDLPLDVVGPSIALSGIDTCDYQGAPWYVDYSWTHAAHGLDSKRGWNDYSGAPDYELPCMTCHDPHGSYTLANPGGNPYMIREVVDGTSFVDDGTRWQGYNGPPWDTYGTMRGVEINIDGTSVDWGGATGLCNVCHADWDQGSYIAHDCTGCQICHAHGAAWGEHDWEGGDDDTPCGRSGGGSKAGLPLNKGNIVPPLHLQAEM